MKRNNLIIYLLLISVILGCREELILNSYHYTPTIVVEGMITNEPGPYTIKLYYSSPINNFSENPIENCIVSLQDNNENSEILTEIKPGIYISEKNGIRGEIGKSYKISITTASGKEYNSEFQKMKSPVGIEDVDHDFELKKNQEFPEGLPGYQFYVSTEIASENNNYFLWELEETYQYKVDFNLWDIYFGIAKLDTNKIARDSIIARYKYNLYRCWDTQKINYVYTGKTSNLVIPVVTDQPLKFVGTDTKKLQERYSLLVKQYTINEDAYYFWKSVEDQSTNENFLNLTQPYNILGNIKNLNDPDEIVSGYFTVGSVSEKRIFVEKPNTPFYYDKCSLVTDPETIQQLYKNGTPPFFLIEYGNAYGYGILVYEYCVNCTLSGGENTKPDFWIDK